MTSLNKIKSLEFGRTVAMLAIIGLHCQLFTTHTFYNDEPWLAYLFNQATRFAVPLFFLISGYLIQPKLSKTPFETAKRYSLPLIRIWLVWSILSLLMPFNFAAVTENGYLTERTGYWNYLLTNPLNSVLEGGLVHLWFIPSLIMAVVIIAWSVRWNLSKWMIPVAAVLYIYGVLAGGYSAVSELEAPFFTRNGPFFSTLMVVIGYVVRERSISCSAKTASLLALLGMTVHFAEAYGLHQYGQVFSNNDYLFGTALWGVGTFLLLLAKPNWGSAVWIQSFADSVLGIYVSHLLVAVIVMNISGMLQQNSWDRDITLFAGTTILTLLLVKGIERTSLRRILFR
ncbi:acyltransferase [Vibrio ziniensis]|uniref:Acyltransferase family protein n=1 Tax=Vibrio ziniensis TaxID=2711221 RepID=A0A6G7CND7_9VIBR|nr:acyltransferase family protein [Vibrio ziniensis]QIH43651.1 acyltransferase family protein [Vibrio ziniensis]